MPYTSVVGESSVERTIEKSRFIAIVAHIESEDDAKEFLARTRAAHPLATHICYAFIADRVGNLQRFSDAGEPQGTAGMPILGVIKAQKLTQVIVAVVRYFGGVKLGAGGLTRAYASLASEGVAAAEKRTYAECVELTLCVGYAEVNAALRFLENAEVLAKNFGAGAEFTVAVRETEAESFKARARDFLQGRVEIREGKRYYYAFKANGAGE